MSLEEKNTLTAIMQDTHDMTKLARDCLVRAPSLSKPSESEPIAVFIVIPARTCYMSAHMKIMNSLKLST
jgi:hypothetical protein